MASGDRTKQIMGKVQFALASLNSAVIAELVRRVPDSIYNDTMGEIATRLCEDTLCLEKSATLSVAASAATEPSGFYRGKLIVMPSGYSMQLKELSVEDFDLLARPIASVSGQTPLYYKRFGGTMTFYPTVATASYTMYYYGLPTTTPTASVDPETPAFMDKCIEYGVTSELASMIGDQNKYAIYMDKYERERVRVLQSFRKTKSVAYTISAWE